MAHERGTGIIHIIIGRNISHIHVRNRSASRRGVYGCLLTPLVSMGLGLRDRSLFNRTRPDALYLSSYCSLSGALRYTPSNWTLPRPSAWNLEQSFNLERLAVWRRMQRIFTLAFLTIAKPTSWILLLKNNIIDRRRLTAVQIRSTKLFQSWSILGSS